MEPNADLFCLVNNGTVTQGPQTLPQHWTPPGSDSEVLSFNLLTTSEAAAHGWLPFVDQDPPSYNHATERLASGYTLTSTEATRTWSVVALSEGELVSRLAFARAAKRALVISTYDTHLNAGFPIPNSDDTLQVREQDKANWLTLKDLCQDAIDAGAGAAPCAMPPRTTNNSYVPGTYAETKTLLQALRGWAGAMMARLFALKDAVDTAEDEAALNAIDVTSGWP